MGVKLQSALGGSVELNAPSTASNFTMTVPAGNGTVATTDQLAGFRNRIINGNFNVWQRGTSITPSLGSLTSYVSDRWASYQTGAATAVLKSTGFNGQPNCLAFNGVASNTEVTLFQCVESINSADLVGSSATFSLWVYSTIASKAVNIFIDTANTIDTFSATTNRASVVVSVPANTWTQYQLVYENAAAANGIRVRVNFGACVSGTFAIAGAQLEKGTVATPFDYRPYGTELALCQRYYEIINCASNVQGFPAYCANASIARSAIPFKVMKRASPTATMPTLAATNINAVTGNFIPTSASFTTNVYAVGFDLTIGTNSFTSGQGCLIGTTGTGITLSAEL